MKNDTPNTPKTPAAKKPTLSESQMQGALDRANEALAAATKVAKAAPADHQHRDLLLRAARSAEAFAFDCSASASVADAQYQSRKAQEAAAAASWLFGQRV